MNMQVFLENNSLYVVLAIVLMIWAGIVFFLFSIDKKVKRLEKKLYFKTLEKES
jgi:CcmD family protein